MVDRLIELAGQGLQEQLTRVVLAPCVRGDDVTYAIELALTMPNGAVREEGAVRGTRSIQFAGARFSGYREPPCEPSSLPSEGRSGFGYFLRG